MKLYYYLLFSQLGSILFELNKTKKKKKPRIRDDSKDGGKRLALDQALEKRQNHSGRKIDRSTRPLARLTPNFPKPSNGRTVHSGSRSHYAGWRNIAMFLSKIRERKERSMPGIERRMNDDAQEPKTAGVRSVGSQ